MKNSAWHNRILQEKLQELPIEGDANAAWQKMQGLLDVNLPVNTPAGGGASGGSHLLKTVQAKLIAAAGVAVTATTLYLAVVLPLKKKAEVNKNPKKQYEQKLDSLRTDSLLKDSLDNQNSLIIPDTAALQPIGHIDSNRLDNTAIDNAANTSQNIKGGKVSSINGKNITFPGAQSLDADKSRVDQKGSGSLPSDFSQPSTQPSVILKGGGNTSPATGSVGNIAQQPNIVRPNDSATIDDDQSTKPVSDTGRVTADVTDKNAALNTDENKALLSQANGDGNNRLKKGKKDKVKNKKPRKEIQGVYSDFQVNVLLGANGNGSFTSSDQNKNIYGKLPADLFIGLNAAYRFNQQLSVGLGVNVLSPKQIKSSMTDTSFTYTSMDIFGNIIPHKPGPFNVNSVIKFYTVDVPVTINYHFNDQFSMHGGPVISIPVRQNASVNKLAFQSAVADSVYTIVSPLANTATVNNKVKLSITAGATVNLNRFFIDAGYMRTLSPYTVTSHFGTRKVSYSTWQLGIGYKLFTAKKKE